MITISSNDGDQCHIHGHILKERADPLYESANWRHDDSRADVSVQASGDVLQLFTNWIYNGVIHLPEEHEENNNPLTFEATCQRALKDAQNGLPITSQHRWIKREGETSSVEGIEIPQLRMARLVDLYEFAHEWDIVELEQDILESVFVTLKVAQKLPRWDIVNKASSTDIQSDLFNFLVELFVENWTSDVSNSLCMAGEEEVNVAFTTSVFHKITCQKEEGMLERRRDALRAVTAEGRLKTAERELARYRNALASAQKALATTRQALTDVQSESTTSEPVKNHVAKGKPKRKPTKPAAKTKPVAKANPSTEAQPAMKENPAANNKRPREEDAVDRSELFKQSLKRNCRELRPRTSTLKLDA